MKKIIASALVAMNVSLFPFVSPALASVPYHGGVNLKCSGANEIIYLNSKDSTITRNGVIYESLPTQSFAFWYFTAYDSKTNQFQGWDLHVFSVSDSAGPGNSFIYVVENDQRIPVDCVKADIH